MISTIGGFPSKPVLKFFQSESIEIINIKINIPEIILCDFLILEVLHMVVFYFLRIISPFIVKLGWNGIPS